MVNMLVELADVFIPRYTPSTGRLRATDKPLFYVKYDIDDDLVNIEKLRVIEGVLYCLVSCEIELC